MRKNENLPAIIILVVTIIGSAYGFWALWPNEGQARFRHDTITVNAEAAGVWGAEISQPHEWGVPIEFVDGPADVTFVVGPTRSQYVEGYGTLYVAGETNCVQNSRRWVTGCTITLSNHSVPDTKDATAIVVHEFGHALGAQHDDTKDSIMGTVMPSKNFTPKHWSWHVTAADRAALPY